MSPKAKKLGQISLLALILLLLFLNWFLDANRYKAQIQLLLQQQLQHKVQIGQIQHSLFSPSKAEVQQLVIGELSQPLLSIQSAQLHINVWPLFSRELEVETFILDGLSINASLSDIQKLQGQNKPEAEQPATKGDLPVSRVFIKSFVIKDIDLNWHAPGQDFSLTKANLALNDMLVVDNGQILALQSALMATVDMQQLRYNNLLLDDFTLKADLAGQKLQLTELKTELLSGQLAASAEVDLARDFATSVQLIIDGVELELTPVWLREFAPEKEQQAEALPGPENPRLPIRSLLLSKVDISNSRFYSSLSAEDISAEQIQLQLRDISLVEDYQLSRSQPELQGTFEAEIHNLAFGKHKLQQIKLGGMKYQLLDINQLMVVAPGIDIQLQAQADMSQAELPVKVQSKTLALDFGAQNRDWFAENLPWPEGVLNADVQLSASALAELPLNTLNGAIKLSSQGMQLHKLNLNGILAGLEQTEKTSLMDVGSFLVTGPLGLIASQVANLGQTGLTAQDGVSQLQQVELNLGIDKGILATRDVALSTDKYRVALDGKIDLPQQQFDDLKFYILDHKGCADIQQTLNGPMNSPDGIFSQAVSTTVLKPFSNILSQAGSLLTECKPVYQGKVTAPQG